MLRLSSANQQASTQEDSKRQPQLSRENHEVQAAFASTVYAGKQMRDADSSGEA